MVIVVHACKCAAVIDKIENFLSFTQVPLFHMHSMAITVRLFLVVSNISNQLLMENLA